MHLDEIKKYTGVVKRASINITVNQEIYKLNSLSARQMHMKIATEVN